MFPVEMYPQARGRFLGLASRSMLDTGTYNTSRTTAIRLLHRCVGVQQYTNSFLCESVVPVDKNMHDCLYILRVEELRV